MKNLNNSGIVAIPEVASLRQFDSYRCLHCQIGHAAVKDQQCQSSNPIYIYIYIYIFTQRQANRIQLNCPDVPLKLLRAQRRGWTSPVGTPAHGAVAGTF